MMDALHHWRNAPFPEGSDDDAVDEVHAQVAQWDALVADLAIPLERGQLVPAPVIDLRSGIAETLLAVQGLAELAGAGAAKLRSYAAYCELLLAVLDEIEPLLHLKDSP